MFSCKMFRNKFVGQRTQHVDRSSNSGNSLNVCKGFNLKFYLICLLPTARIHMVRVTFDCGFELFHSVPISMTSNTNRSATVCVFCSVLCIWRGRKMNLSTWRDECEPMHVLCVKRHATHATCRCGKCMKYYNAYGVFFGCNHMDMIRFLVDEFTMSSMNNLKFTRFEESSEFQNIFLFR